MKSGREKGGDKLPGYFNRLGYLLEKFRLLALTYQPLWFSRKLKEVGLVPGMTCFILISSILGYTNIFPMLLSVQPIEWGISTSLRVKSALLCLQGATGLIHLLIVLVFSSMIGVQDKFFSQTFRTEVNHKSSKSYL